MIHVRALRGSLRRGAAIIAALGLAAGSLSAAATPSLAAAGSQTTASQTTASQTTASQTAGGTPSLAGPSGPVIDRNFADPDVMKVGRTYYAYATNTDGRHIRWATSTDLTHWTVQPGDALPTLGAWADPTWTFPPG